MAGTARMRYRNKATGEYVAPVVGASVTTPTESQPYDAAGTGRRATSWRSSRAGPNAALSYTQSSLVGRSRGAVRQNPLADQILSVHETNVVGTGIKPQWATGDAGLNRELDQLWLEWTDEADADGRLDFYGQQALTVRAVAEAGEVFQRMRVRRPADMTTVPLQLQLLENEFCPLDYWRQASIAGHEVRAGVQFDPIGRRAGYWMYRQHPYDWTITGGRVDLAPVFVPASEINHIAQLRRPGQIRGEPWLTRALIKLRDLDKYDDAELMRKQVAALIAGFITRPDDSEAFAGEGEPDSSGVAEVVWEPGSMQMLKPGEEVTFSTPAEVGGTYEVFMRAQQRAIAVAGNIMYEQLTGDYSQVNDRTFRASVNEFRRRCAMLQHHLVVFQSCRPVARRWLDVALMAGIIRPPAGMDLRELRRIRWIPQGWSYIHPVQEVDAEIKAIQAGIKSRSQVVSERGDSAEAIDREQAEDNARADALGNVYTSDGRKAAKSGGSGSPADGRPPEGEGREEDEREEARGR